jgi:hypothetical protein
VKGAVKLTMRSRVAWIVFVVVFIVIALLRFNLTALREPGPAETRLANLAKRYFIYRESARNSSAPPRHQSKHRKRRFTLRIRLRCMSCRGWPVTAPAGAVDVPTRIRSHEQAGAELLRPGAVLDYPEWNPLHRNAGFR